MSTNVEFREWKSCAGLLAKIPLKYHKNWIPHDLNLTCIAAHVQFIALGTNIGLVYWYNRIKGKLMKLVCSDRMTPISKISLLDSVDLMLAVGNDFGIIAIFQIPKVSGKMLIATTSEGGTDCFHIENIHRHKITCFEWSLNGQKLFSADSNGLVSVTQVDYSMRKSSTFKLCNLNSLVSQMSYHKGTLLISSLEQSYFCYLNSSCEASDYHIVGGKPRQIQGIYGGFINKLSHSSKEVLAVMLRPNWILASVKASNEQCGPGELMSKISFKSRLKEPHKEVLLLNPLVFLSSDESNDALHIVQMGDDEMIAYDRKIFHILKMEEDQVMLVASCRSLKGILDLSITSTGEIYVLENSRTVVRVSSFEDENEIDGVLCNDPSVSPIPEGGLGLETISNFFSSSGKKIFNKFPKLKKLGELGELILGEVDTCEEANENSFIVNGSFQSINEIRFHEESQEDLESNKNQPLDQRRTTSLSIEGKEDNLLDVLNLKEYLPEESISNSSSSSKKCHPEPLVQIPIDIPITFTDDESPVNDSTSDKAPLSIEIRKDPLEEAPHWFRLSGTGQIIKKLHVSYAYVIILDNCDRCFISYRKSEFKFWILLRNFDPWDHLSTSPDGRIVWRLYKSTVYSLYLKEGEELSDIQFYKWNKISEPGILDIYVAEHGGYMLDGVHGTLVKHSNISPSKPFDPRHFVVRPINESTDKIVCVTDDTLYALDRQNQNVMVYPFEDEQMLFLDIAAKDDKCEMRRTSDSMSVIKSLTSIRLIEVSSKGTLHFTDKNKNLNCWFWSNFLAGSEDSCILRHIEGSLWISNHCDLFLNEESVLSSEWKDLVIENSRDIVEIYCESLNRNGGVIWTKKRDDFPSKSLFYFNPKMVPSSLVNATGTPKIMNEILMLSSQGTSTWMLDSNGIIYTREGISRSNPIGDFWIELDNTQLSSMNVKLKSISLGTNIVWAVDLEGKFYMRLGSFSQDKDGFMPAWITGDVEFNDRLEHIKLSKIFASYIFHVVWVIDDKRHIYCRSGISDDFRLGSRWTQVKTSFGPAVHMAISGFHVWALSSKGRIFKRIGITATCPEGLEWLPIPGERAVFISSSADGSLFILTANGRVQMESSVKFNLRQ